MEEGRENKEGNGRMKWKRGERGEREGDEREEMEG